MRIRRLGWAGLELEAEGEHVVVDLFQHNEPLEPFTGPVHGPLPPPAGAGAIATALVTHLHADHCDPGAIAAALAPDGLLLRPAPAPDGGVLEDGALLYAEQGIAERGLATQVLAPWESVTRGPFTFTAVPAVDGFGDPQVSWAVAAGGVRILHAGDTLFHGAWWLAKLRLGDFDAVFLPANGPRVSLPHRQPPSPLPAAMTPEQAAAAAAVLGARLAVPIHYDTIDSPPRYEQVKQPAERFLTAAQEAGVAARVLATGEELTLAPAAAQTSGS
ncbi:MBL fold metallo-hydrolase [Conexibacter sp. JD483]|uniref:MBL fold metallo-hydrolase n=1 Tax=unclassified Conexibacter TaxID=2627773 RepID=UPI0027208726|nr:MULTISPECIES: MBL fold metallo-hydrolase [unclassified Conexibacter]MDO8184748.1 MBL fold metallo-hydrolase [Conexibacter sp. CPCC 205706]MDO8196523.1 MBL fold metallo-hydrolase [Conexibacter sp. CPCC 205762]MDR9369009.1 MBL fold metallo-hydrolase [Conexibacter sp. JD483]